MQKIIVLGGVGLAAVLIAAQARAIGVVDIGPAPPPTSLGIYDVIPFPNDGRDVDIAVTEVTPPPGSPVAGNLIFGEPLWHYKIGSGWDTWSNPYANGDVYWFDEVIGMMPLTLQLPWDTKAFYLYTEPNLKFPFTFTIQSSAAVLTTVIDGDGGAYGVGFYAVGAESLLTVTVENLSGFSDGFAIGQFGINGAKPFPDGPIHPLVLTLALIGLGTLSRRFHARK